MNTQANLRVLAGPRAWCLVAAVALAGCSGAASGAASPVAPPSAGGGPTGTTGPAATGDLAVITGWQRCAEASPTAEPEPDATYVRCTVESSDPSLTGEYLGWSKGGGDAGVATTMYGSGELTTDEGSWSCTELIMGTMENGTGWKDQLCVGHGPYVGQTAYVHAISGDSASSWGMLAWIQPSP